MTRWLVLLLLCAAAGCYEQPLIPRDKPIRCGATPPDCPTGLACVAGVCAPVACESELDCPQGLVCGPRGSCALASDGGLDAAGDGSLDTARSDGDPAAPDAAGTDAPGAGGSDLGIVPADASSGPDVPVLPADAGGDL